MDTREMFPDGFTDKDQRFLVLLPLLIQPIEAVIGPRNDFTAPTYAVLDGLNIRCAGQLLELEEHDLLTHGVAERMINRMYGHIQGIIQTFHMTHGLGLPRIEFWTGFTFTPAQQKFLERCFSAAKEFLLNEA